ncbi:uncharacterized protein CDV56_108663 [Aspergillus thermomutatus]|uniref:Uncharacterized protein n=1 Tax=Aspergillus thermomutatus TaxID=41047 RepID=A0A397HUR5_ASPTH|nr:uncharacterized protein CDV56_108663 [Aspergillus thermomutatus]RHZ64944.1 hypothetical protein CDV56_108663 [Aspergillus thermomutatus]
MRRLLRGKGALYIEYALVFKNLMFSQAVQQHIHSKLIKDGNAICNSAPSMEAIPYEAVDPTSASTPAGSNINMRAGAVVDGLLQFSRIQPDHNLVSLSATTPTPSTIGDGGPVTDSPIAASESRIPETELVKRKKSSGALARTA